MIAFTKTPYEEINRYHDFALWMGSGETVELSSVTVADSSGTDQTSSMIANVSQLGTQALYTAKGGTSGNNYTISIKVVTSTGQKFEDDIAMGVE